MFDAIAFPASADILFIAYTAAATSSSSVSGPPSLPCCFSDSSLLSFHTDVSGRTSGIGSSRAGEAMGGTGKPEGMVSTR